MEVLLEKKTKVSMLLSDLQKYPQLLVNVKVKDKLAAREDEDVKAAVKQVEEKLGEDGRILVRESGTEPLIRVMVEAGTDEICAKLVDEVVQVIRKKGHAV
jgi:phosphoglucosamine mutase